MLHTMGLLKDALQAIIVLATLAKVWVDLRRPVWEAERWQALADLETRRRNAEHEERQDAVTTDVDGSGVAVALDADPGVRLDLSREDKDSRDRHRADEAVALDEFGLRPNEPTGGEVLGRE